MGKKRVYELAKELKLTSKDLIKTIEKIGIPVSNHMSSLSDGDVERIRQYYTPPEEKKIIEKRIQPSIIRRRVKRVVAEPEEVEAPPEEVPEEVKAKDKAPDKKAPPKKPGKPKIAKRKKEEL